MAVSSLTGVVAIASGAGHSLALGIARKASSIEAAFGDPSSSLSTFNMASEAPPQTDESCYDAS